MECGEQVILLPGPTFLVTCAAGQEAAARRELRQILGDVQVRPLFLKGNLLLESPLQAARDVVSQLTDAPTRTIGRVVPLDAKASIGPSADSLGVLAAAALAIARFREGDTFRVECKRRGTHEFRSRDVQRQIGLHLEAHTPAVFSPDQPTYVIVVEIFQDWAWLGCCAPEDVVRKTITRARVYPPGKRPLNRAEKKLREALAGFGLTVEPGMRALDLGAAPGGWSKVLAEQGAEVLAVDPAELDPRVASLPGVTHFRASCQELLSAPNLGQFDLITNDMNLDPAESAGLVASLVGLLKPAGSVLMTVKFMTPRRRKHVQEAVEVLAPLFDEHRVQRVPHNAKETTILFRGRKMACEG